MFSAYLIEMFWLHFFQVLKFKIILIFSDASTSFTDGKFMRQKL